MRALEQTHTHTLVCISNPLTTTKYRGDLQCDNIKE